MTRFSPCAALVALVAIGCSDPAANPPPTNVECAVRCGTACCAAGEVCKADRCEPACMPQCANRQCGSDGCGGECGRCSDLATCNSTTFQCEQVGRTGNADCFHAFALEFDDGGIAAEIGDTNGMADNGAATCGGGYNADVVYSFTLSGPSKVEISVEALPQSSLWPTFYVRSLCDTQYAQAACVKGDANGGSARGTIPMLGAGTWYLWVDGWSDSLRTALSGTFKLQVKVSAPDAEPAANDKCRDAAALVFDATGRATASGDTRYAFDDGTGACGSEPLLGADVVYALNVTTPATLVATATGGEASGGLQPALYLRKGCDAGAEELACRAAAEATTTLTAGNLQPGTYYLYVDGANGTSGAFTLDAMLGDPPPNDACAGAQALSFDSSGTAVVTGDTAFAVGDTSGEGNFCGGGNGADLVYSIAVTGADKTVKATVTPSAGSKLTPIVYLRRACDDAQGDVLACRREERVAAVTATANRLSAGTYFLWVDSASAAAAGAFTLQVEMTDAPVPANDLCAGAEALSLDASGKASVTGSTAFASHDYQGTCGSGNSPLSGPDVVYKLELADAKALFAKVTRTGYGLQPAVYIRKTCDSAAAAEELACARAQQNSDNATAGTASLQPGTYYVFVDGVSGSTGGFRLDLSTMSPVMNDSCVAPEQLVFDASGVASVGGDTSQGTNSDSGTCQNAGASSRDLVYSFTLQQDQAVEVTVTPVGNFRPAVYVRSTCDQKASQVGGGCVAAASAVATTARIPVLAAGTYYVWVDGSGNQTSPSSGAFTLQVKASPAPAAPANDACGGASALAFTPSSDPAISVATASGDTTAARNGASGVGYCAATNGGDLVYSFTLTQARKVTAKVTPDASTPGFAPYVYLRQSCAGADDSNMVACGAPDRNNLSQAVVNTLQPGSYFVWVDGADFGKFQLEVTQEPSVPGPTNDNCFAPAALAFSGSTATASGTTLDALNDTRTSSLLGSSGADVVYGLLLTQPQRVTLRVQPDASSTGFRPIIIVRRQCADLADQVATASAPAAGQPVTVTTDLAAGQYWVWVDGQSSGWGSATPGAFTLSATLETPNDTCASPVSLPAATTVSGNTAEATDSDGAGPFSTACAASLTLTDADGPDLVYSYQAGAAAPFTVTVTPAAGFDAVVWVTQAPACGGSGDACLAAADRAGAGGVETVTVSGAAGTTYYIIVDSFQPTMSGAFTISVQ